MTARLRFPAARLPLKLKLLIAAAVLISGLFIAYNLTQYVVLKQWLLRQEEISIREMLAELQNHFSDVQLVKDPQQLDRQKRFIESINENDQLVRILDANGDVVLAVSDSVPESWVSPMAVSRTQLVHTTHGNDRLLVLRSPLNNPTFSGTIEIVNNLSSFSKLNRFMLLIMLIGALAAVGISSLGGWIVARQLLRPVQSLAETMKNIQVKGWQERVKVVDNGDELSRLAELFNRLMDRVESSFRQQKQFVEDASHELKTPLSILEGHLSLLDRWGKKDPAILDESLHTSLQQVARLKGIMQELLDLTRAEADEPLTYIDVLDIESVIRDTFESFAILHKDFECRLDTERLSGAYVRIDQRHMEQIVLILLDNAVKYSPVRKHIALTGQLQKDKAVIRISDKGMGIADRNLPYLFDRFYRVDTARSRERGGTGLGLSIAKRLVEKYKGSIHIDSQVDVGTIVTVELPVDQAL